jgi:hypothetical protein
VTFSLPLQNVRIHFIDGSATTLALDSECAQSLGRVVDQVNLSFAPKQTPSRTASRASSSFSGPSSSRASSPTVSSRRSTSALLLTLLSPLLPSQPPSRRYETTDPQYASRMHRRQARSLLVDTYRRYVLPELKSLLPGAYLSWAIESEVTQRTSEYEGIKLEINSILASVGYDASTPTRGRPTRARSFTSSTASSIGSESDSDQDTPLSSVHSSRCSTPLDRLMTASPHAFLLAIPPAHDLPPAYRLTYSHHLADLTRIASRLSSIKRLDSHFEREESKRRWLENLERGKAGERALRRAWSNGQTRTTTTQSSYSKPTRSSGLWRSWTSEDEERYQANAQTTATHPAMMDDSDIESDSMSISGSSIDEPVLITPRSSVSLSVSRIPTSPEATYTPTRPSLARKSASVLGLGDAHEIEDEAESDDQAGWQSQTISPKDEEKRIYQLPPLPPRVQQRTRARPEKWSSLPQLSISIPKPTNSRGLKSRISDWVRSEPESDGKEEEVAVLPILY